MHLGFLTGCMGNIPLKEKAQWAADHGMKSIEISCWPKLNDRDYSATDIDVAALTQEKADEINAYLKEMGLTISSLAYYDNNLAADLKLRETVNNHVYKVIDAAEMLHVDTIGTFVGRDHTISLQDNFILFEKIFSDIVNYAEKKNIRVMIENCPMTGWQVAGLPGTISFSPELWREMFSRVPNKNFGLNYDPSHLRFMLMDYITPIKEFKDRIFHVHAKDVLVKEKVLSEVGVFNKQLFDRPGESYWVPTMPGLGDIDFKAWIDALKDAGYDGVISIEHEDPKYEGSLEKVQKGLEIALDNLRPLI